MKQIFLTLATFFVLLFIYTKFIGPIPFSVTSVVTQKTDTFSVTAEEKASVSPDLAVINLGVQTQGTTVKQTQDSLNNKINQVSSAIKKIGIESKDLQTSNYSLHPVYDWNSGKQRITGYQANSNLTIKVRELEKANSVIDAATDNGANQVSGISFTVEDKTKVENELREKAVAKAKQKAEDAARIAGFKLGKILNYSENFGGADRIMPMYAKAEGAPDSTNTQIETGSEEINLQVTLSYEIR